MMRIPVNYGETGLFMNEGCITQMPSVFHILLNNQDKKLYLKKDITLANKIRPSEIK